MAYDAPLGCSYRHVSSSDREAVWKETLHGLFSPRGMTYGSTSMLSFYECPTYIKKAAREPSEARKRVNGCRSLLLGETSAHHQREPSSFSPVVVMTDTAGYPCGLDITPLEKYPASRKRSRANFASVDQCLDVRSVHRMVALLTNQCDRLCGGDPVVAHDGISLSQRNVCICCGWWSDGWFTG